MPSCRLLPHGAYSLLPTVLTTMGWLASLFQDGCDYARLSGDIVADIALQPNTPWLEVGFAAYREPKVTAEGEWSVVYEGKCLEYPDTVEIDAKWKVAKGFAFLALVLGGGGTFFLWFNTCCVFSRGTWRWAGYEILFASIFQAVSFLWFRTDMCQNGNNKCDLFWGSKTDIVATVFWFVAALCIFCYYPKPVENMGGGDGVFVEGERPIESGVTAAAGLDDSYVEENEFATTQEPEDDNDAFSSIELQSKSFEENQRTGDNSSQGASVGRPSNRIPGNEDSGIV